MFSSKKNPNFGIHTFDFWHSSEYKFASIEVVIYRILKNKSFEQKSYSFIRKHDIN